MSKLHSPEVWLSSAFMLIFFAASGQNLIVNPSAESIPTSNGWTQTQGVPTNCYGSQGWRMQGNQNDYPVAQHGTYFFNPGCRNGSVLIYELYQNINVSANAAAIDAGTYSVTFSGYTRSYNQSTPDQTEIVVEYRSQTNSVLSSYATGRHSNISGWVLNTNTRIAPVNTRIIRIRLIGNGRNGSAVDAYFDNLSLTASIITPVNLISFTATASAQGAQLKWETSDEVNNSGFHIERSANGHIWETIGFIPAATGHQNIYQYQFVDTKPAVGINHYRLKQEDRDGKYEYSVIRNVQYQYTGRTILYPNPAGDVLSVLTQENYFRAQIINLEGKVITTFVNQKDMRIQSLAPGMYYLKLLTDGKVEILRFLKK